MERLDELTGLIERHGRPGAFRTPVPRLTLVRQDGPADRVDLHYSTMMCLVAQGQKSFTDTFVGAGEVFLSILDTYVLADMSAGYRAAVLEIETSLLLDILTADPLPPPSGVPRAFAKAGADAALVDAVTRWVRLLDEPDTAAALAPLVEREVLIRLLTGPLGATLRAGVRSRPVVEVRAAVTFIVEHLTEPFTVGDVARAAHVSEATLFRLFKATLGVTPVQYRQAHRLQRARSLLAAGAHTAESAALAVGYRSASQFGHDYRARYGRTPGRDREHLMRPDVRATATRLLSF
ncbi:AraC family transcriptional regulator [Actinoplanes bogorensis]|uniref:AraC family transcriptional regulator n=1 Tax=Paractinoplanes bogorensis TaxID=1610840 RepID=A0ABS5Z098_9ACTN|nr:AraC family transcriptional regulator [Actinoplanes bogorensis]MBU2667815.1 AraC family transcriptional regulator [Actinoplanes bogorensis]